MLDPALVLAEPDRVVQAGADRGLDVGPLVRRYLEAAPQQRELWRRLAELSAARRRAARDGGAGSGGAAARGSREELGALRRRLAVFDAEARELLLGLPNLPAAGAPPGRDRSCDQELRRVGEVRRASRPARPHWEVAAGLGWLSPGGKGAGGPGGTPGPGGRRAPALAADTGMSLRGQGPALLRALAEFLLRLHRRQGYSEVWVPALVGEAELLASGHLPHYGEGMYRLEGGRGWLAPSLEPGLLASLRGRVLDAGGLPLAWVAAGSCFRARAVAGGRRERGLVRRHQFSEVRLLRVVRPEATIQGGDRSPESRPSAAAGAAPRPAAELELLVGHVEEALRLLGLPYRVVLRCAGRLSFSAALTCDLEAWMPAQGEYVAISSCTWYGEFQARRAQIRVREAGGRRGRTRFVHTLSASALPLERCLAALLENHQQEDGSLLLPEALRPFWPGGRAVEPPERARL